MGYVIRGSSSGAVALSATPMTVTLPVTTNLNDTVVICIAANNSTFTFTGSGGGATWTTKGGVQNTRNWFVIGALCSAGQTTVTLASTGSPSGHYTVSVISGTTGVIRNWASQSVTSGSGLACTSPSLTYVPGDLLIGLSTCFAAFASGSPSWSDGAADTLLDKYTAAGSQACWSSYATPATGTTTTYTSAVPPAGQGALADCLALEPANQSEMFF